jgi:general nucleoside transport system permease protein
MEPPMTPDQLLATLATILALAAPLIFAAMGETLSERAGVVNLSLDGSMLLAAMGGFVVGKLSGSVLLGFLAAAAIGALIALVLCALSLTLRQSQTAVGFVLALLATDLSSFLGAPYVREPGVAVPPMPIPLLSDLPVLGRLLFSHDLAIYASFLLIPLVWWYLFRSRPGLTLRALGERPEAAYARGVDVVALRYGYAIVGGMLVGIAGAVYSLDVKQGWSFRHTAGAGWIALAIVIFGGWNPLRVALGCYLFSALQTLGSLAQSTLPNLPTQVFQVAPFALMILVLALVNSATNPTVARWVAGLPGPLRGPLRGLLGRIAAQQPAALGQNFSQP